MKAESEKLIIKSFGGLSTSPRKRFGQNFLHDKSVIAKIFASINPQKNEHLVEIGPGLGALTKEFLHHDGRLDLIEIDRDLLPGLQGLISEKAISTSLHDYHLHSADALQFDYAALASDHKLRIFGNLPYNISTPLLFHLLDYSSLIKDFHFMLQREVAERISATPGQKNYGRLSVMLQYHCHTEILFLVPNSAFSPRPKVESAIIRLTPHAALPYVANNYVYFANLVREAFNQRRKTLTNSLKGLSIKSENLQSLGINPKARAEELNVNDFVMIANRMSDKC